MNWGLESGVVRSRFHKYLNHLIFSVVWLPAVKLLHRFITQQDGRDSDE